MKQCVTINQLKTARGNCLDDLASSMGAMRQALETDAALRIRLGKMLGYDISAPYIPEPGDLFTLSESSSHTSEVFTAMHIGRDHVFSRSLNTGEESLIRVLAGFERVDVNGPHHRRAMLEQIVREVDECETPLNIGVNKIETLISKCIDQAIDDAEKDFQPTSDQVVAIGHRYHLAIENALDEMSRPGVLIGCCSVGEWATARRDIIRLVQTAVNAQNEKETLHDVPF